MSLPENNVDISVILPTYCECGNIGQLIEAIEENLAPLGKQVEILVVDDASPDGTAQVVKSLSARPGMTLHCFVRTHERGLATAVRYGLEKATGERLLVMDTDFNHNPSNLACMIKLLDKNDLVIGSRFVKGGGMENHFRYWSSFAFNLFIRAVLWTPITDNLSGFFSMRRESLSGLPLDFIFRGYGEYFIRLVNLGRRQGLRIRETPVFYTLRHSGESKSHFGSMIRDYSRTTFELLRRP